MKTCRKNTAYISLESSVNLVQNPGWKYHLMNVPLSQVHIYLKMYLIHEEFIL